MNDSNPYVVLPLEVADRIYAALQLAKELSTQHAPHLEDEFRFVLQRMEDTAGSFHGSHNKPATTKTYDGRPQYTGFCRECKCSRFRVNEPINVCFNKNSEWRKDPNTGKDWCAYAVVHTDAQIEAYLKTKRNKTNG